jgi:DNA-binding LytR/AlgR family response regulator
MIRAFIIDDEPLAVARLNVLLSRFNDVEIVGSATDASEALQEISRCNPDALFVDVEMPDIDGFDLIEAVGKLPGEAPLIIFVTAYPKFAVDAFDKGAIDFVTKPVRVDRLGSSVERLRSAIQSRIARDRLNELVEQLDELRAQHAGGSVSQRRFLWINRRGELIRLDLDRLERAAADGEYVRLFINGQEYLHRASVSGLMTMVDPNAYVRVHRSHIIRRDRVVSIGRRAAGGHFLFLESGARIPVGRRFRDAIRLLPTRNEGPGELRQDEARSI